MLLWKSLEIRCSRNKRLLLGKFLKYYIILDKYLYENFFYRVVINEKLKSITTNEMTSTNINKSALQSKGNTNNTADVPETCLNKSAVIKPKPLVVSVSYQSVGKDELEQIKQCSFRRRKKDPRISI